MAWSRSFQDGCPPAWWSFPCYPGFAWSPKKEGKLSWGRPSRAHILWEQVRERGVHWASSQEQQGLQGPPCSPALPSLGRLAMAGTVCHLRQGCCSVNTGWEEHGSHLEQTPASLAVWRPCPSLTACSSRWLHAPWCPLLPVYFVSCFILPVLASPLLPRLHLIFPPVQSLLV